MSSVILYFGSFNPIHNGHMAIAEYVLSKGLCDELWFVVSPQNPLKSSDMLISEADRLAMVEAAIGASGYSVRMKACDAEFALPKPSYTIDTLTYLQETYPHISFSLLIGGDIMSEIHKWKEWERLLNNYHLYVYPRQGYEIVHQGKLTYLADAPYFDFSSTEIRDALQKGSEVDNMLPAVVKEYIKEHKLWM